MSVRLGISPIGWSNDDLPELGGDIPLDTCLAEAREAGFEGIEVGQKFPRDPALLRPLLAHRGLHLISGWYSGRLLERSVAEEVEAVEQHRALLAAMGCTILVYAETTGGIAVDRTRPLSSRPILLDGGWRDFGTRLTELADQLAERGIRLAYHHHMGTVVETAAEIDRLIVATGGSVGLLLANQSFLDAVLDGIFTVPGDGAIDFAAVLTVLKAADYHGWLVVEAEQDPAKAPPQGLCPPWFCAFDRSGSRYGVVRRL
jgi:inosose dehydratase